MTKTKAEFMAEIAAEYERAEVSGLDPRDAVRERFPGIPGHLLNRVAVDANERREREWLTAFGVEPDEPFDDDLPFHR